MISAAPAYIKAFTCALAADSLTDCAEDAFISATTHTANGEAERALEDLQHAHTDLTAARLYASIVFETFAQCKIQFTVSYQEGCNRT